MSILVKKSHIAVLAVNRPEALNALDSRIPSNLSHAVSECDSDDTAG